MQRGITVIVRKSYQVQWRPYDPVHYARGPGGAGDGVGAWVGFCL
jgi:hypothetical protein